MPVPSPRCDLGDFERERIICLIEEFQFVYEARKVDGYSKGKYMMVDAEASRRALIAKIRKTILCP